MQLAFVDDPSLVVRANTGIDHPGMKRLGVMLRFQLQSMLFDALGAKVIAQTANANHKRVVVNVLSGRHCSALLIHIRRELDGFVGAVKSFELTNSKSEVVPMGLRHVIDFVVAQVHAARSDFMQLGFPNMGAVFIDQSDERPLTPAIGSTQTGGEFQTASAATHDDDFVLCAHLNARDLLDIFSAGNQLT
jgi:hypothetical protein